MLRTTEVPTLRGLALPGSPALAANPALVAPQLAVIVQAARPKTAPR